MLDEKSSKIVVNGKVVVDVNSARNTWPQSLKAERNSATGAHKFKRGTLKESADETVACTNICG